MKDKTRLEMLQELDALLSDALELSARIGDVLTPRDMEAIGSADVRARLAIHVAMHDEAQPKEAGK